MTLVDINFTPYIPTTLLGLFGLISGYLFFYFKNKDDNKLKKLQNINSKDRIKEIEMSLNELGVTIDTSTLNPGQKFELVVRLSSAKTRKYLITSITLIILSIIIAFLIWSKYDSSTTKDNKPTVDTSNHLPITTIVHDTIFQSSTNNKSEDILNRISASKKQNEISQAVTTSKNYKHISNQENPGIQSPQQNEVDNSSAIGIPKLILPNNNQEFDYPRYTTLQWTSVPNAIKYKVNIEILIFPINEWKDLKSYIVEGTSLDFQGVGAQQHRWRVKAIGVDGQESDYSAWRYIIFRS